MNRDDLIMACFCLIDDVLPTIQEGKRLRVRGFEPRLSDSEVITMEVVGTYLGFNQDKALFTATHTPAHSWSVVLGRVRYCIDTVFSQVVDRCGVKRVWVRDRWHLCNRLLRMVLMHTIAVLFNIQEGNEPFNWRNSLLNSISCTSGYLAVFLTST